MSAPFPLAQAISHALPTVLLRLRRAFPGVDEALLEDATMSAVEQALRRPAPFAEALVHGDLKGVQDRLYVYAWRQLRGWYRSPRNQREHAMGAPPERADARLPDGLLDAREAAECLVALLAELVRRSSPAVTRALMLRLFEDHSDVEAGAATGVTRETVCRIRRQLVRQLQHEGFAVC